MGRPYISGAAIAIGEVVALRRDGRVYPADCTDGTDDLANIIGMVWKTVSGAGEVIDVIPGPGHGCVQLVKH